MMEMNPLDNGTQPLSSSEFKQHIVSEYAADADGVGIDASIAVAVDEVWPAPDYREHQQEAVVDILHDLYVSDNDVVTLSAPTGAGKSLILHGVMAVLDNEFEKDAFFTTPLNALIDQIDGDEFISDDVVTLKGKNNYSCVHRQDRGAPVDKAVCQRVSEFQCEHKEQHHEAGGCPYYGRKHVAQNHPEVVTNLSYLMANSMIPEEHGLSNRELVVVDECQKIEDFALNFVGVTVSEHSVPVVWDDISRPPQTENVDQLSEWLESEVLMKVQRKLEQFESKPELREEEVDQRDDLQEFARKVQNLLSDVQNHHWVASVEGRSPQSANTASSHEVANHDYEENKVEFNPIFVGRFLDRFLWSQGHKVVLSSATIPKGGFLEEIGLDDRSVGNVEVESTFPPERRGVYTDEVVGKMTMGERDQTIPKMARKIAELANHHEGKRGFIHCHSYKIAQRLYDALPASTRERTTLQDGDDREQSLEDWLNSPIDQKGFQDDRGGQIFLSVAMDEGISLDDNDARWQVIAKAAYPFMGAKRVEYRMDELDDWTWYANKASIALQQAVGRGMRSKNDWCHTYILDTSAVQLIERNEHLFEDWFKSAVDIEPEGDRA
jgi:Rad3-related DNA helicase